MKMIFKCKMCGGSLEITPDSSVCECEYCGSTQTVPKVKDENLNGLFNRANILRMKAEFDKAADIYEKIILAKGDEAEAYWGLVLCEYGIEYVEDPVTYKRVPTCHRSSFESITANEDYKNALKYADIIQKSIYEEEAKNIEEIQKGIIALATKEEPYDVFICYKETDNAGKRTQDSVIANDIYHQLTMEGFKVFYAAITLEDKLGKEYEPYIFSALNSAKVMLALGTKPEYLTAVWVKNEWSRFMKSMKKDHSKLLIPCYRDMDPYELPEEFAHLQAQDMSKIGFINDVVRGIKKVITKESEQVSSAEDSANTTVSNVSTLLKRGGMALEDHEWDKANGFFEEVLNQEAECAEAYLGLFMSSIKTDSKREAKASFVYGDDFTRNRLWMRTKQFAIGDLRDELLNWENDREDRLQKEAKAERERLDAERSRINHLKSGLKKICSGEIQLSMYEQQRHTALGHIVEECQKKLSAEKRAYADDEKLMQELHQQLADYRERLSKLGIFNKKEKKQIQEIIPDLEKQRQLLAEKKSVHNKKMSQLNQDVLDALKEKDNYIEAIRKQREKNVLRDLGFADGYVRLGQYDQGKPIVWKILKKTETKILLISKYGLIAKGYHDDFANVTWEKSSLRKWLNTEFINSAFNPFEKELIMKSKVNASINTKYHSQYYGKSVEDTKDLIFLLSTHEAETYFENDLSRTCKQSEHIKDRIGSGNCWWWLRTAGSTNYRAAVVAEDGAINYIGTDVNYDKGYVRPALWINLD